MILPFQTKINRQPTYFVEKIWAGLENHCVDSFYYEGKKSGKYDFEDNLSIQPKIHTIREDKTDRWQVGKMIDFYINNRTKKAFCFAPRIPVVSLQTIKLEYTPSFVYLYIDDECLEAAWIGGGGIEYLFRSYSTRGDCPIMHSLAINDGFNSITEFLNYFYPKKGKATCFEGKIIHWTDFKY